MVGSGKVIVDMVKKKKVPTLTETFYINDCLDEDKYPKIHAGYIPRIPLFSLQDKSFYFMMNNHNCRFITYDRYQKHVHAEVYFTLKSIDISKLVIEYVPPDEKDFVKTKTIFTVMSTY